MLQMYLGSSRPSARPYLFWDYKFPSWTTAPMVLCWLLSCLHRCLAWQKQTPGTTPLCTATLTGCLSMPEEGRKDRKLAK